MRGADSSLFFLLSPSNHWGAAKSAVNSNFFFFLTDKCVIFDQNRNVYYGTLVSIYRADFPYYNAFEFYVFKSLIMSEEHLT